jgi:four helix bundle protein
MSLQYRTLVVWQRADDLFIDVHRLTLQSFPSLEQFELGRQIRRAAYSVPANIVEGFARQHSRDRINFFNIASASLSELTYGLHAAHRLGYLDDETYHGLDERTRMVAAPLNGLIRNTRMRVAADVTTKLGAVAIVPTILSRLI